MFDQQDDEDEDEDEDMADADSLDSDVEVIDADDAETGSEEDDQTDEDEDDNEEDEEELAAFDAKLAEALGTHRADDDNEDLSSDSDMDDDEMEAVDEMLVKVFKARQQATSKKKDKKDAKETMTNFKNRVLDLLEIYVKKCHGSVLALDLVLPLLRLTRKSTVKQISTRAGEVLREYTRLCKGNAIPSLAGIGSSDDNKENEDEDEENDQTSAVTRVWDLLRAVHKEAAISGPAAHAASASQASIFLVKVLVAQDKRNISQIVDIYAETRKAQLLSNKCHVQPGFFTDWNNWCVNAGRSLKD